MDNSAGDRALETARKIRKLSAALPIAWNDKAVEDVAALIQSAMNAQEREWRQPGGQEGSHTGNE